MKRKIREKKKYTKIINVNGTQTIYVRVQNTRQSQSTKRKKKLLKWNSLKTTTHTVAMKRNEFCCRFFTSLFFLYYYVLSTSTLYFVFDILFGVVCFDLACVYTILIDIIFNATEPLTFFLFDGNSNVLWLGCWVCVSAFVCVHNAARV